MTAILVAISGWDPAPWHHRFRAQARDHDVRLWPNVGNADDIAYACVWKPPHGVLATLPNLKAIFSLGAGVDHLMADPDLPRVPIARVVDRDLTQRMTEYVTLHTLLVHRRQRLYDAQQRARMWREHDQPAADEVSVGVMGLGELGSDAALVLRRIGFQVAGWSRTPRSIAGIETYHGAHGLEPFLAHTEILIVLLPLTPATQGILNIDLFRRLKRTGSLGGAHLINAGRGGLQIDDDVIAALDEGALRGATLDVFPTEPLPADSPLWSHPRITITPHNAAVSDPKALVANVLRQIERLEAGQPLEHVVDRTAGY